MTPIRGYLPVGGYRNRGTGLPWRPGSGFTRSRLLAEKVTLMTLFKFLPAVVLALSPLSGEAL